MPVNSTGTFGVIETNPFGRFLPLSGGTLTGPVFEAAGSATSPSYSFSGDPTTGVFQRAAGSLGFAVTSGQRIELTIDTFRFRNSIIVGWTAGAVPNTTPDTSFSRVSAGILALGTGTAGSTTGTLRAAALAAGGSDFTVTAVSSVSPTSPNRTVTISYGGTTYYVAAKTTND